MSEKFFLPRITDIVIRGLNFDLPFEHAANLNKFPKNWIIECNILALDQCHKVKMISIQTMKRMKDMKIDFSVCILHALHILHGKIKYSVLNFMTLGPGWEKYGGAGFQLCTQWHNA
ncbi:hypothetical protein [Desulfobacter sp.]